MNNVTVGELALVLSLLDDDMPVFIRRPDGEEFHILSYRISRYEDAVELVLSDDEQFGLQI